MRIHANILFTILWCIVEWQSLLRAVISRTTLRPMSFVRSASVTKQGSRYSTLRMPLYCIVASNKITQVCWHRGCANVRMRAAQWYWISGSHQSVPWLLLFGCLPIWIRNLWYCSFVQEKWKYFQEISVSLF